MIDGLITTDTILGEMPENSPGWVVVNHAAGSIVAVGDKDADKPIIWIFLKQEDARHFARILQANGPAARTLDINEIPIHDFIKSVLEDGTRYVAVFGPNQAQKYFEEHPELLAEYYEES